MQFSKIELFTPSSPASEIDPRLSTILKVCLPNYAWVDDKVELRSSPFWNASSLGLDKVSAFQKLETSAQNSLLQTHASELMREACYIEIAGLSYTARMTLESSKLEERLLYSAMAAEEAKHFSMLRPHLSDEVFAKGPDVFTDLIGQMIAEADRKQVVFLIQVLLEGWGVNHFAWMAAHCQSENLKVVFKTILKDEARHHAAGLALANCVIQIEDERVVGWLETILASVSQGPTRLMAALEIRTGSMSSVMRAQVLEQLDARAVVSESLKRLRNLIEPFVSIGVLRRFEEKSLLRPGF